MPEHSGQDKTLSSGELKILEYARRINDGESEDEVLQGLPRGFKERVQTEVSKNKENHKPFFAYEQEQSYDQEKLLNMIPPQYQGLPSEVLEEVWQLQLSSNETDNTLAEADRALIIEALRQREKGIKQQSVRLLEQQALRDVRDHLGSSSEIEIKLTIPISSREVSNDELVISSFGVNGLTVGFFNNEHSQDAFAVRNDVVAISDGMSSYGKSGLASGLLAEKLAEQAESQNLQDIFEKTNLVSILESIKDDEFFIQGKPINGTREANSGLATALVLKKDAENKALSYASIGDSPLFVFDYDSNGNLESFELLNANTTIDNDNYFTRKGRDEFEDPSTPGLGVREDGRIHLDAKHIKTGSILYKKGRVVVAGSDFFTKMLNSCPEALKAKAAMARVPRAGELFAEQAKDRAQEFADLWIKNPSTNELTVNPHFIKNIDKQKLQDLLQTWKEKNSHASDDITMAVIEMDSYFN